MSCEFLTLMEFAEALSISRYSATKLVRSGTVEALDVSTGTGRVPLYRIPVTAVEAMKKTLAVKPSEFPVRQKRKRAANTTNRY